MSDVSAGLGKQQTVLQKVTGYVRTWGRTIPRTEETEPMYRVRDLLMDGGIPSDAAGTLARELFDLRQRVEAAALVVHRFEHIEQRVAALERKRK